MRGIVRADLQWSLFSTAVSILGVMTFLLAPVIWLSTEDARERVEEKLNTLIATVKANDVPIGDWSFLYLYEPGDSGISATDKSIHAWQKVHEDAVEQGKLKAVETESQDSQPPSWLDSAFETTSVFENSKTPISRIPIRLNTISAYKQDTIIKPPNVSLWFAADGDNDVLYILNHIRTADSDNFRYVLLLTVHYSLEEKIFGSRVFRIEVESMENGSLLIKPDSPDQPKGKGWALGSDWFFELELSNKSQDKLSQIDAISLEVLASLPQEDKTEPSTALYRIGTSQPLPLMKQEMQTYARSRHLLQMMLDSELYAYAGEKNEKNEKRILLAGTRDQSVDANTHRGWLPTFLYGLYLSARYIGLCPTNLYEFDTDKLDERGACYRVTAEGYQLRMGGTAEKRPPDSEGHVPTEKEDREVWVFTEEKHEIMWDKGLIPLVAILLVLFAINIYLAEHRRHGIIRKSEADNEAKAGFVGTFVHEAGKEFHDLGGAIRELVDDRNRESRIRRLERIKAMRQNIWDRLQRAAQILEYEKMVRDNIANNKQYKPFDLSDSVAELVEIITEDRGVKGIEFHPNLKEGVSRPALSVTAPPNDDRGAAPDGFFTQAMARVLDNAIEHRDLEQDTITITLDMERGFAILRVFNYRNKPPISNTKELFERGSRHDSSRPSKRRKLMEWLQEMLGLRHTDDGRVGTQQESSVNQGDHRGLGLFVVDQIVRGYGGSSDLDNFQDSKGLGVKVTLRLPLHSPLPLLRSTLFR